MTIEIIRPDDRTAWLAARRKDVTASVIGALVGVHPYTTPYGLWAEKTGLIPADDSDSPQLRRGRLLEPVAIELLREERPDWTVDYRPDNTYWRDSEARIGATPDAFATREDIFGTGCVQIKTASDHAFRENWRDPETEEIQLPLWIAAQVLIEAHLTGCTWASVVLMVVGRGIEIHVIDVPLHAGVIRRLRAAVAEFWRMVDAGERPAPDWLRDGATVLDVHRDSVPDRKDLTRIEGLDQIVGRYVDSREAWRVAGETADHLKPQIIMALGPAELGFTDNWEISTRTTIRAGEFGQALKSRTVRIRPRENIYAASF